MATQRPLLVYIALVLGVISFAFSPILVRWADDAPGVAIAVWRTSLAVLFLAPVAWRRIRTEVQAFDWRDVGLIIGAGVFLGLHFIAWIESLYHTTVASASVLVTTSPLFLVVLGYWFLGERLTRIAVIAIVVAVAGAATIAIGDAQAVIAGTNPLWGNGLALGASLLVSFYLLIGRVVRQQVSWLAYVFPLYAVAALTTVVAAFVQGVPLFGYWLGFYGLCALMAIGPQILGHGSFNYALQYFPAALVGLLALLEPVGSSILAYFIFGEQPPPLALAGMLVVLVAVGVVVWSERRERNRAQEEGATPRPESAAKPASESAPPEDR